nr:hypothetical protein [Tanacetum cinerariifolium]
MTSSSKTNSPNLKRKTTRISVKYPNYVNLTSSSEEQPNKRTPSPPPRKKSLSPPQAPSKSISSKTTHYTSLSSPSESPTLTHVAPPPKLHFFILIKLKPQELPPLQVSPNDPYVQIMDNWPPGPSNPSPPPHIVISNLEDSTVTYTELSSPFEDLSNIGSPGVDGLPMMPQHPYDYVEAALQAPPSPDYVPSPEHLPLLVYVPYVPEPAYPEYMPPEDDILPAEEQPLLAVASLIADSLGYNPKSDPEKDLEEDDEDPKEDPADYLTDREDKEEEEESSRDDDDDDEEEEKGEDEEHLAPADSVLPLAYRTTARMFVQA